MYLSLQIKLLWVFLKSFKSLFVKNKNAPILCVLQKSKM